MAVSLTGCHSPATRRCPLTGHLAEQVRAASKHCDEAPAGAKTCVVLRMNNLRQDKNPIAVDMFRTIFESRAHVRSRLMKPSNTSLMSPAYFTVAIHVRRGDLLNNPEHANTRIVLNKAYTGLLKRLLPIVRRVAARPILVVFHCEGMPPPAMHCEGHRRIVSGCCAPKSRSPSQTRLNSDCPLPPPPVQRTPCPTNTSVRTVFFEDFIVRWTRGGGGASALSPPLGCPLSPPAFPYPSPPHTHTRVRTRARTRAILLSCGVNPRTVGVTQADQRAPISRHASGMRGLAGPTSECDTCPTRRNHVPNCHHCRTSPSVPLPRAPLPPALHPALPPPPQPFLPPACPILTASPPPPLLVPSPPPPSPRPPH